MRVVCSLERQRHVVEERIVDREVRHHFDARPRERDGGGLHEQRRMYSRGETFPMLHPQDPHEDSSRCGDPLVGRGHEESRINVQG
jgi:hypothetical protein